MLLLAATLVVLVGLAHSYLGEKFILMRLFRQPLPRLFGDDWFTRQTLRFAWHITTVAWLGFAALLVLAHRDAVDATSMLWVVGATFGVSALIALIASRGRHLAWLVFGAIAAICLLAGRAVA